MKTILIINPYSKSGKSGKLAKNAVEYLNKYNFQHDVVFINQFDEAYNLSQKANLDGYDNIIALGGDGTINNVINGFYDDNGNRISNSKFGVIYTGTSPDFCKSYKIPTTIDLACDKIRQGNSIKIPVGKITYNSKNMFEHKQQSSTKISYFVCCANIGLGSSLALNANSGIRKYLGDFTGTFVSLIKTLTQFKASDIDLVIDSQESKLKNTMNISVGITRYIASGIQVRTATNNPDQFYLIKFSQTPFYKLFDVFYRIYSGKIKQNDDFLNISSCKSLTISCNDKDFGVEFDGDPRGILPCSIEFAKDKLDLIC